MSASEAMEKAFRALETYEQGSSRGALVPIDEAVRASLDAPAKRQALERTLCRVLDQASVLGQVFLLKKLAWIGGGSSVPSIAQRLHEPGLADAACRALEALPCPEAARAIRDRLTELPPRSRIGGIHVLGRKRHRDSVAVLALLLEDKDQGVASAAAEALGRIATAEAARVLRNRFNHVSGPEKKAMTHPLRECADRLSHEGYDGEATDVLEVLD